MRLRLPAAIATTLLLATMLGGCFLLPEGEAKPTPSASDDPTEQEAAAGDPAVGDCWSTEDYNWAMWQSWRGDPPVDCDDDHTSYTFAVLEPLGQFDEAYKSNGFMLEEPATLAFDACHEALDEFMGATLGDFSRLVSRSLLPTKSEWKEGARWVRCDLVVYKLGSSVFEEAFADLPDDVSKLQDAIDDESDYFDFCIDTDDGFTGYGPFFSETAVYSNCSRDPMWRLDGYDYIPGAYNSDYPGDEAMAQYAADGCLSEMDPRQWGYAHYPDADTWFPGDRTITCWAYEWEVPADAAPPV